MPRGNDFLIRRLIFPWGWAKLRVVCGYAGVIGASGLRTLSSVGKAAASLDPIEALRHE